MQKLLSGGSARLLVPIFAFFALHHDPVLAQEIVPEYKVLDCTLDCGTFIPARRIKYKDGVYPARYNRTGAEAVVLISMTITAEGKVTGAFVEKLAGAPEFAENALRTVNSWAYAPATLNDGPVDSNFRIRYFYVDPYFKKVHDDIKAKIQAVQKLAADGRPAEAIAAGEAILAIPTLSLVERSLASYSLVPIYLKAGQRDLAMTRAGEALVKPEALPPELLKPAIRAFVGMLALAGQYADALWWFNYLNRDGSVEPDDPLAKAALQMQQVVRGNDAVTVTGNIPAEATSWSYALFRRSFTFAQIDGKIDRFDLRCAQHGITSPVSDKAAWTIPQSWSGCRLYVFGAPGATFHVISQPPPAK